MGLFRPFLPIPANSPRGLLHQPLAPGPCNPEIGCFGGGPRKRAKKGTFRDFAHFRGNGRIWGLVPGYPGRPVGRPRDGDRAPPRGVDVKPPSAAGLSRSTRAPGALPGLWDPSRGPGDSRSPFLGLPGPWGPRPGTPRGLVLHQPLAAGPCPRPGARETRRGPVPGPCVLGRPPPPRTGAEGRVGVTRASRPQAGH